MSEEFEDVGSFDDTFNDSSTDVDTELVFATSYYSIFCA